MKRALLSALLVLTAVCGFAQTTHKIPTTDGNNTFTGSNDFRGPVTLVSDPLSDLQAATKHYVDTHGAAKADDTAVVHKTGDETIAGDKTFSGKLVVGTTSLGKDDFYYAKKWLKCDGTDETTAFNTMLADVAAAGGGTILLPPTSTSCRADGQLLVPNTGGSNPVQKTVRLYGCGGKLDGAYWGDHSSACTTLDLRYSSGPKLLASGFGLLEVANIGFIDGAATAQPFIQCNATSCKIHDNSFVGSKTSAWDQDAVVLGGTSNPSAIDGTEASAFEGYGTVISGNYFQKIAHGMICRNLCNGVVFEKNVFGRLTGGSEAILIDGTIGYPYSGNGNVISFNLFELDNYQYGITLQNASRTSVFANSFWDAGVGTLAHVQITGTPGHNLYNTFIGNHQSAGTLFVADQSDPDLLNVYTTLNGENTVDTHSVLYTGNVYTNQFFTINGLNAFGYNMNLADGAQIKWSSTSHWNAEGDTVIARESAKTIKVGASIDADTSDNTGTVDAEQFTGNAATATNATTHIARVDNPHAVTATQVGLGSVNNTADTAKPVSTATQTALDLKANINASTTGTASGNRGYWTVYLGLGTQFSGNNGVFLIPDSAITITRIIFNFATPPSGCAPYATIQLRDVTASNAVIASQQLASATSDYDSGAVSYSGTAGHTLRFYNSTAAVGCGTNTGGGSVTVQYHN